MLAAPIRPHFLDNSIFPQLRNDMISLRVRVAIGGVCDLECKSGQGQTGIFRARSDPENAGILDRTVGLQPEVGRFHRGFCTREA